MDEWIDIICDISSATCIALEIFNLLDAITEQEMEHLE
jgi:hypothetical protein